MSRINQNIMHLIILIFIFCFCIVAFGNTDKSQPKGVFLPSSNYVKSKAISLEDVEVSQFKHGDSDKQNLGTINVTGYSEKDNNICGQNLEVAIKLAAENGINSIKYLCSKKDKLGNVLLQALAFKDSV